MNPLKMLINH